jgi:hypothetical protein
VFITTHDRQALRGDLIDPSDQSVYTGAILVVHLRRFTRLRERIGFIDQEDDATPGTSASVTGLADCVTDLLERARYQPRHLTDSATPARCQAQREQLDLHLRAPSDLGAERSRERGLPRSYVACQNEQRRARYEVVQRHDPTSVVALAPTGELFRIKQQQRFLDQPILVCVEPDEPVVIGLRLRVREPEDLIEEARSHPAPPTVPRRSEHVDEL